MHSGQRKAGKFQVIKFRAEPTVHGVTGFARGGKVRRNMVNNRRQEVLLMA